MLPVASLDVLRHVGDRWALSLSGGWEAIWNETYKGTGDQSAGFNTAGWNSSFTGLPLPEAEIHQWADDTVGRIRAAVQGVPSPLEARQALH